MKVLTFSRQFPKKHPKAGEPTFFVEKIKASLLSKGKSRKHHTIRVGNRWRVGEMASLRYWSGKPYRSKQKIFAQVQLVKIFEVLIENPGPQIMILIPTKKRKHYTMLSAAEVAKNDGLNVHDFIDWIKCHPKKKGDVFIGQILCWSDKINY